MNGIAGIDAGSAWLPRDNQAASPTHDFADALTRDTPRAASRTSPATGQQREAEGAAANVKPGATDNLDDPSDDRATVMLAGEATSELTTMQQQASQPVAPVGITEAFIGARVFGLHLSAQGYLSVLSAAQLSDEAHTLGMSQADMAAAMDHEQGSTTVAAARPTTGGVSTSEPAVVPIGMQFESLAGFESDVAPTVPEAAAVASASAMAWPERVIRSVRDANQGLSIWLRDYRASAGETSKLVGELTEHARTQGERLNRIILNGREVWTSQGGTNHGDSYVG